jgi:hypothetical protein
LRKEEKGVMTKKLTIFVALLASTAIATSPAFPETSTKVLRSLPGKVQKSIEETRATCRRDISDDDNKVTSGDEGLVTFAISGKQAVLIDPSVLCGGCYAIKSGT